MAAPPGRKKFARNLRAIRTGQGLSEAEVAGHCRFSLQKVRALERAAAEPYGIDLVKLASALGISVNFLFADVSPWEFRRRDRLTLRMLTEIEGAQCDDLRLAHIVALARALEVLPSVLLKALVWRGGVLYCDGKPVED